MSWSIPNCDAYILYAFQEFARWSGANAITVSVIIISLQWMQKKAIQTPSVVDDKIITWLLYVFTGGWRKTERDKYDYGISDNHSLTTERVVDKV